MLKPELLNDFFLLGSDPAFRAEVFQIIRECKTLQTQHLQMILDSIMQMPAEKVGKEEFEVIAGNRKFKDELKQPTLGFFWRVLCNSSQYREEAVASCVANFSAYTGSFTVAESKTMWQKLGEQLATPVSVNATVSLIEFFQPMIERPKSQNDDVDSDASYTDSDYSDDGYSSSDEDENLPAHLRKKNKKRNAAKIDDKQMTIMLKSLDSFADNVVTNVSIYNNEAQRLKGEDNLNKDHETYV